MCRGGGGFGPRVVWRVGDACRPLDACRVGDGPRHQVARHSTGQPDAVAVGGEPVDEDAEVAGGVRPVQQPFEGGDQTGGEVVRVVHVPVVELVVRGRSRPFQRGMVGGVGAPCGRSVGVLVAVEQQPVREAGAGFFGAARGGGGGRGVPGVGGGRGPLDMSEAEHPTAAQEVAGHDGAAARPPRVTPGLPLRVPDFPLRDPGLPHQAACVTYQAARLSHRDARFPHRTARLPLPARGLFLPVLPRRRNRGGVRHRRVAHPAARPVHTAAPFASVRTRSGTIAAPPLQLS